jgi:hypothetical protein
MHAPARKRSFFWPTTPFLIYFLSDSQTSVLRVTAIHFLVFSPPKNPLRSNTGCCCGWTSRSVVHPSRPRAHSRSADALCHPCDPPARHCYSIRESRAAGRCACFLPKKEDFPQFSGSKNRPPLIPAGCFRLCESLAAMAEQSAPATALAKIDPVINGPKTRSRSRHKFAYQLFRPRRCYWPVLAH